MANGEESQAQFSFSPTVIPQGDGSYLVKPDKPIIGREKISVSEAVKRFGSSKATVLRLFHSGMIEGERPSPRKTLVFVDSIERHLKASQDPEYWEETKRRTSFRQATFQNRKVGKRENPQN